MSSGVPPHLPGASTHLHTQVCILPSAVKHSTSILRPTELHHIGTAIKRGIPAESAKWKQSLSEGLDVKWSQSNTSYSLWQKVIHSLLKIYIFFFFTIINMTYINSGDTCRFSTINNFTANPLWMITITGLSYSYCSKRPSCLFPLAVPGAVSSVMEAELQWRRHTRPCRWV